MAWKEVGPWRYTSADLGPLQSGSRNFSDGDVDSNRTVRYGCSDVARKANLRRRGTLIKNPSDSVVITKGLLHLRIKLNRHYWRMDKSLVKLERGTTCTSWNYSGQRLAAGFLDGMVAVFDARDPASSSFNCSYRFKVSLLARFSPFLPPFHFVVTAVNCHCASALQLNGDGESFCIWCFDCSSFCCSWFLV